MRMEQNLFVSVAVITMLVPILVCAESGSAKERAQQAPHRPTGAAESAVGSDQAVAAARAWLDDLKAKDKAKIAGRTRLPFKFATTNRKKSCDRIAVDETKLAALIDCIEKREKLFVEELGQAGKLTLKAVEPGKIPPSLAALVGTPAAGERLVSTFINGDGISFELVLSAVAGDGSSSIAIRALFLNTEIESG